MNVFISGTLGPHMKIERAATHLKELQARCERFKSDPYTITEHDDEERALQIIEIQLNQVENEIPLLIGEFAHSLRSALDHLAWQLALLSGRRPSNSSCFPIHSSDSLKDRERFMRATWDIPCEAIALIKSFQPHLRGKALQTHPLWQLNKLSNLDKHVNVGYAHTQLLFRFVTYDGVPQPPFINHERAHKVEVMVPIAHKGKVKIQPEPPVLTFGRPFKSPGAPFDLSEGDIAEMYRYVREEVLPPFERFFA